ncbi:MAG: hypothetical protein ACI9Y1_000553 [Lentisphaeria bacterium]|jgi:uncharacterized protein YigA (DUF484 family)
MSDSTYNKPTNVKNISDEDVVRYLRAHKEFFIHQPDLLTEIELPHHSGKAISLVEKQVSVLRDRNMDMRHRLSSLLDNARDNDRLFDKTKRLVLALIESASLADLVAALYYSFEKDFGIHYTRLVLFSGQHIDAGAARTESIQNARDSIGKRLKSGKAVSGGVDIKETQFLFDNDTPNIGSAAMVVLSHGDTLGVLAIGNQDPSYYHSSMGTLFLGYIGEVLNRLLPKHL